MLRLRVEMNSQFMCPVGRATELYETSRAGDR